MGKNLWRPARYLTRTALDQRQKERDEMERVQEEEEEEDRLYFQSEVTRISALPSSLLRDTMKV